MKSHFTFLILFCFCAQPCLGQSQADLQVLLSACSFFAGGPLSAAEQQVIINNCRDDFARDPAAASAEIAQLSQLGASLAQLSDPMQLVAVRQQCLFAMYEEASRNQATPSTIAILTKVAPLAVDPQEKVLLLQDDLEGCLAFISAMRQCQGLAPLSAPEQNDFGTRVVNGFAGLPPDMKELLISGRVIWSAVSQRLAQWNQQQQAHFAQQVAPMQGQNMSMDTYKMLSQMSQSQHMTSMNILQNMGDTGGYWDVVDRPSW
jgi:hypothetical protein